MKNVNKANIGIAIGPFAAGVVLLLTAVVATLMLVLQHISGLALPGCGVGSACAQLTAGRWGKIPGISWPVSHVGLAYFVGALAAWVLSRRSGLSNSYRWFVRAGFIASLMYVVVMIVEKQMCPYCLATHAANFAFWILLESISVGLALRGQTGLPSKALCATFVIATLGLAVAESQQKEAVQKKGESELAESTKQIIAESKNKNASTGQTAISANPQDATASSSQQRWPKGFTSRHRIGPDKAPIRIVLLSDYQCPDCQRTEQDISTMLAIRKDISVAFKYYPMCKDCNKFIHGANLHPNACWAARAAEAASILGGEEAFWKMHRWLWDKKGKFETTAELGVGVASIGLDPKQFVDVMTSPETLKRVEEDVEDGQWLGLFYTPMVFINGVELKGVFTPGAVPRAVEMLAAKNPPAMGCENDFPVPAGQKLLDDWREKPVFKVPPAETGWPIGPPAARVQIIVWGDLAEPNSAKVDQTIREFMSKQPDARYDFRQFPVNQACNPSCQVTRNANACLAHKAAVAAGLLAGAEAYWKMHRWLMDNQPQLTDETLKQNAYQMGLDVNALLLKMEGPEVAQVIMEDAAMGKRFNLTAVPTIYLNGKNVPRWIRGADNMLDQMLDEAAK